MDLFDALGFRRIGEAGARVLRERRALLAWVAARLEGDPASPAQAEALARGEAVEDLDPFDRMQILNLVAGFATLADLVEAEAFRLDKANVTRLHGLTARRGSGSDAAARPDGRILRRAASGPIRMPETSIQD